jgi:hypothetical protein
MTRPIFKATLLTFIICFISILAKAQIGYDYARYDLGASIGFNQFFGDVATPKSTNSLSLNFNYNQTPFLNYIFEFQEGKLAGGDATKDLLGRQFTTDYQYYSLRLQLQAGEIIDYSQSPFFNALKNLYVGTGMGMIFNNINPNNINRYSILMPGYYTPGVDNSKELFIPARIGYEFKIFNKYQRPDVKIDIGYQCNFILGDELDGFKVGTHNDIYTQFTVGVKFAIGGITSASKQINY